MRFVGLDRRYVRAIGSLLCCSFYLGGCQQTEPDYASQPSLDTSPAPEAAIPPEGALRDAAGDLEAGDAKAVARKLGAMQPVSPMEKAWHQLLLGEAWMELGAQAKAVRLLQANYEQLRDARPAPDAALSRILARSLKKLGTYYRDRQELGEAYTLHQMQWLYMRRVGSLKDRHEALISLDVDAALLRNFFASEQWLREALQVALQMPEGEDRRRSLIITWNNLSASLQELIRFPEAEAAARESHRLSKVYDQGNQHREFREVWALAQLADVLSAFGLYLETKDPKQSRPTYDKAKALAIEAVMLAEQQGLSGEDRAALEQRMRKHCGYSCRPLPASSS